MTTSPLRRTQITVVERMRSRDWPRDWESGAGPGFLRKAMKKPLKTRHLAVQNHFKMQSRVYRSARARGPISRAPRKRSLLPGVAETGLRRCGGRVEVAKKCILSRMHSLSGFTGVCRSEERRVGKE